MSSSKLKTGLISAGALLYFLGILIPTQISGLFALLSWYIALFCAGLTGLSTIGAKINKSIFYVIIVVLITGGLNIAFIGTTTINDQLLLIFYIFISLALTSPYLDENIILIVVYLNAIVVAYKFITLGFFGQIYLKASSNFVSVYLMYPLIVYYCISERKDCKLNLVPALITWILSLLSRGRGGIITTTLLFVGLLLTYLNKSKSTKKVILSMALIILTAAVFLNADMIIAKLNSSVITAYFRDRGMRSSRLLIWNDYLEHINNIKYLICGVDIDQTYAAVGAASNLHNSFLNIHAYNGLIMLAVIIWLLAKSFYHAVKNRCWVYIVCASAMLVRAFTDNVFWPAYGTAVLFFLIFWFKQEKA